MNCQQIAKFHAKRLISKNIPKSFRGAIFMKHPVYSTRM